MMRTNEEDIYLAIGNQLLDTERSRLFGVPCFKINGKPFICLFHSDMVFKLTGLHYQQALGLKGARQFDPSGRDRPTKEWVQVPFEYAEQWEEYAQAAYAYVKANL